MRLHNGSPIRPSPRCHNRVGCRYGAALLVVLLALFATPALAQTLPERINDTGQLSCYNLENSPPDFCNDPGWPGQDGASGRDRADADGLLVKIGQGEAGFDFTKIANDGGELPADAKLGSGPGDWACTRDNVTGLVWQVVAGHDLSWSGARRAAIDANVAGTPLCGHADWRLPSANELLGLVHFGTGLPSIDSLNFPGTVSGYYWTDESPTQPATAAWVVNYRQGYVHALDKRQGAAAARLVRGGEQPVALVDHGNGTVTDTRTGLMWSRCSLGQNNDASCSGDAESSEWRDALLAVRDRNNANWLGHDDWRLPNIKELASLLRRDRAWPAIDPVFANTDPGVYWSSTNHAGEPRAVWGAFFSEGNVFGVDKDSMARVRLVRTVAADPDPGEPLDTLFADDFEAADVPPQPLASSLPILVINTVGGAPIVDRENYVDAAIEITSPNPAHNYSGTMGIRGRGNSTWNMPKQPYRLRLDTSAPLLGMPGNRHWVLLANHTDKSLLRTGLAMELGWRLDMSWNPRAVQVELVLNGQPRGVYQLAEHIRIGGNRVDIVELEPGDTDPVSITGGYLMEIDNWRDCEPEVFFETTRGVPVCIDTPGDGDIVPAQYDYISTYVQDAENVLYGPDYTNPLSGYAAWLDPESYVQYYLANELMKNQDARDWSSIWMYKDRGGLLKRGPLWDFDIAAGNINYSTNSDPRGFHIRGGLWYWRLFQDPVFATAVRAHWDASRPALVDAVETWIDDEVALMGDAADENFVIWGHLETYGWPNAVIAGSHAGEVAYLKDWLRQRIRWLDENL